MSKKIYCTIIFFVFTSFAFAQTADVTSGCVPLKVTFTAPSGASTYYWDFKDGASSILQNPSNLFINPGTYVVDFRTSATGAVVGSITINVYPKPNPQIVTDTIKNIGCLPYTVNFRGIANNPTGVAISGYNWTFGDGVAGNGQTTSHTYTQSGFFAVGLELSSPTPSCNVTVLKDSFVVVAGFSGTASASPLQGCSKPHNVAFTNSLTDYFPIKSYSWSFGDGTFSTTKIPPTKSYADTGSYSVKLVAMDTFGCKYNYNATVNIKTFVANFTSKDTVCIGGTISFTADTVAGASYIWSLPNIANNPPLDQPQTLGQYTTTGVYPATLFVIANGCIKTKTKQITVIDPVIKFKIIPDSVCSKNFNLKLIVLDSAMVTSAAWTFERNPTTVVSTTFNGTISSYLPFDSITWSHNEKICLRVNTRFGCTRTYCQEVYFPSVAHVEPTATQGCAPLTTTFINKSYTVFPLQNWTVDYGDGTPPVVLPPSQRTVTYTYPNPGKYAMRIWIQNQNGCRDTSYVTLITIGKKPNPNFSLNKTAVCPGEPITATDLSPASDSIDMWHYWADGLSNFQCFQQRNNTIQFNHQTGVQPITLEVGSFGCFKDTTISIFVNGPIANYRYKQYCDSPYIVDFIDKSQLATRLLYNFGDNTISTQINPRHRYTTDGIYTATLIAYNDTNSCIADTFRQDIIVSKPIARFSGAILNLCKTDSVTLNASASAGLIGTGCKLNYTWLTAPPQRTRAPLYTIATPDTGFYRVGLVVENAIGCTDTSFYKFNVNKISTNIQISQKKICPPQQVIFDANVFSIGKIDSMAWDFGDGTVVSGKDSVAHAYTTLPNNMAEVSFFARDTFGCTYLYKDTIYRNPLNTAIVANKSVVCLGDTIEFSATNTQNLSMQWDFGNGQTSTAALNKVVYKDTSGILIVTLNYFDITNPVCSNTVQLAITVNKKPRLTILSGADATQEFCFPLNTKLKFIDSNSVAVNNVIWTLNNSTNYYLDSVAITFPRGTNTVSLIVSDFYGCADTIKRVFNVIGPSGDFEVDVNNICVNEDITFSTKNLVDVANYTWDFGDGTTASNVSPVVHRYTFVPNGGSTQAKLTVSGSGGFCPFSVEKTINLKDVYADFLRNKNDTAICFGDPYILENKSVGADSYFWDLGNGTTSNQKEVGNFTYTLPGTYTVRLAIKNNQFGCVDTVEKEIRVYKKPKAVAIGDTICLGQTATIYALPTDTGHRYDWQPALILDPDTGLQTTGNFTQTTPVILTTTNSDNCSDTAWTTVFVIQPPVEIIFDTIVPIGSAVVLPFEPQFGYKYVWMPDTGLSCYACPNPIRKPILFKQEYTVTFNDTILYCFSGRSKYGLDVFPETFIKVPNTFTPNGDGQNDVIYAEGWGVKRLLYFRIYNRWNELVFETNDLKTGWDGRYKNELQSDDIFQFKVEGLDYFDRSLKQQGFIHLMH